MEIIKDFMGQELKVGDYVVISDRTYSKTDYLIYGQITEIKEPEHHKIGNYESIDIIISMIAESNHYLSEFEDADYELKPYHEYEKFTYSNRCYLSILKVNKIK